MQGYDYVSKRDTLIEPFISYQTTDYARGVLTIPEGQSIPPHPGPASTFNLTSFLRYGISNTVSSAVAVVGGRGGARDSKVGKAADEDVVETDDDLERAPADWLFTIDWYQEVEGRGGSR